MRGVVATLFPNGSLAHEKAMGLTLMQVAQAIQAGGYAGRISANQQYASLEHPETGDVIVLTVEEVHPDA